MRLGLAQKRLIRLSKKYSDKKQTKFIFTKIILIILVILAISMLFWHEYIKQKEPLYKNKTLFFVSGIVAGALMSVTKTQNAQRQKTSSPI